MNTVWIAFICGFFLGGMTGFTLMAIISINRQNELSVVDSSEDKYPAAIVKSAIEHAVDCTDSVGMRSFGS